MYQINDRLCKQQRERCLKSSETTEMIIEKECKNCHIGCIWCN